MAISTSSTVPTMLSQMNYDYTMTAILIISLSLNIITIVYLLIRMLWRQAYDCIRTSTKHPINYLVYIMTDEITNTLLIVNAVYCCLTTSWPHDYFISHDTSHNFTPPISVLMLVCCNLARYTYRLLYLMEVIRTGSSSHHKTDQTHSIHYKTDQLQNDKIKSCFYIKTGFLLPRHPMMDGQLCLQMVHHLAIVGFLSGVLFSHDLWWYAVIAVFVEMNNVIASIRQFMKTIHTDYWLAIAVKFGVIELVSIILFKIILPVILLFMYISTGEVSENVTHLNMQLKVLLILAFVVFVIYQVSVAVSYFCELMFSLKNPKFLQRSLQHVHNKTVLTNDKGSILTGTKVLTDNKGSILKVKKPGHVSFQTPPVSHTFTAAVDNMKPKPNHPQTDFVRNVLSNSDLTSNILLKQSNINADNLTCEKNCDKVLLHEVTPHCNQNVNFHV